MSETTDDGDADGYVLLRWTARKPDCPRWATRSANGVRMRCAPCSGEQRLPSTFREQ
jgi:hypothetical protein